MAKKQSNFKKVDTWIDIVKNEHEVLDFWKDADILTSCARRTRAARSGRSWTGR